MTALTANDIVVVPIRSGVGLRLGANLGYLKFSRRADVEPVLSIDSDWRPKSRTSHGWPTRFRLIAVAWGASRIIAG